MSSCTEIIVVSMFVSFNWPVLRTILDQCLVHLLQVDIMLFHSVSSSCVFSSRASRTRDLVLCQ